MNILELIASITSAFINATNADFFIRLGLTLTVIAALCLIAIRGIARGRRHT